MKHLALAALLYAALVVQTSAGASLAVAGGTPQLLWLVLVASVALCGRLSGLLWGAAVGLAFDSLGPERLGVGVAVAVVLAGVLGAVLQRWRLPVLLIGPVLVFVTPLAATFAIQVVHLLLERQLPDLLASGTHAAGTALATAVIGAALLVAVRLACRAWQDLARGSRTRLGNRWTMLTD